MRLFSIIFLCACASETKSVISEPDNINEVRDADGDGYTSEEDCNDNQASINPGAEEFCDGVDNNCDGTVDEDVSTPFYADLDNDGFGNEGQIQYACEAPEGFVSNGSDCDDSNANIYPAAEEICDNIDNDCNDQIDDGLGELYYIDEDGDGFGDDSNTVEACQLRNGLSSVGGDCDDSDIDINPIQAEECDNIDNNCDGSIDEGVTIELYADVDGDGYGDEDALVQACENTSGFVEEFGDCDDANIYINPAIPELCDGLDNDCDGTIDEEDSNDVIYWYADGDGDGYGNPDDVQESCSAPSGYVLNNEDCNDAISTVNPGNAEICDEVDNDCDGFVDDADNDIQNALTWYLDADTDGFGSAQFTTLACNMPSGYIDNASDCDDVSALIYPGATEICDEVDNNCDGDIDDADSNTSYGTDDVWYEDTDGDGFGDDNSTIDACIQPLGYVEEKGDCDDSDAALHPNTLWFADSDEDGFGTTSYTQPSCTQPSGYVGDSTDCNDTDEDIYPGAQEFCDGIDQDCDGQNNDEESVDALEWYADTDEDGFGDATATVNSCTQPLGYLADNTDCDDEDNTVFPDSHTIEVPFDGIDQDCDGEDVCHDLNCDAWPDLILPSYRSDSSYLSPSYVYYGIDQGGVDVDYDATERDSLITGNAHSASYGDFDGDGYLDIVFGAYYDGNYLTDSRVYYGSASGFSISDTIDLPSYGVHRVMVEDLDDDGFDDVVLGSHYDSDYYTISKIFWGSTSGLDISAVTELGTNSPLDVTIGDLDLDGHLDLIFPAYYGSYYANIFWGDGCQTGYSDSNRTDLYHYYTRRVTLRDVDQDGQLDILLPNYGGADGIRFGDGRTYDTSSTFSSNYSWDMEAADLNNDGYTDIVNCTYYDGDYNTSSSIFWSSFGSFSSNYTTTLPTYGCRDIDIFDANQDGYLDLLFVHHVQGSYSTPSYSTSSMVYYGSSGGYSVNNRDDLLGYGGTRAEIADLNKDGYPDLVINGYYSGSSYNTQAYIHWGDPDGYDAGGRTGIPSVGVASEIQIVGGE